KIGVISETLPGERRVALVPDAAARLVTSGFEVVVEAGVGDQAGFTDDAYREAGVAIEADRQALLSTADLVLSVQPLRLEDVRPAVKEEVKSLGAIFLEFELEAQVGEGGYAREQSEEFLTKQRELLTERVGAADVVITTAAIPGRRAPLLVTAPMVKGMRRG